MNLLKLLLVLMACIGPFVLSSCRKKELNVERPAFSVRSSHALEIARVIVNDTATLVMIDAFYRPKNWIRIDTATYLLAGDKKYPINGSEGIILSEHHWMPESGECSFILKFPPLPRNTKSFDFIESDCDDCFKVYDIRLNNEAVPDITTVVPEAIRNADYTKERLPDPELRGGETRVKIHLLGYRDGVIPKKVKGFVRPLLGIDDPEKEAVVNDDGTLLFSFRQYGPGELHLYGGTLTANLYIQGGCDQVFWIDMHEAAIRGSHYLTDLPEKPLVYSRGRYAALNHYRNMQQWMRKKRTDIEYPGVFNTIYGMTGDQYLTYITGNADSLTRAFSTDSTLAPIQIEWLHYNNQFELAIHLVERERMLHSAYKYKNKLSPNDATTGFSPVTFDPERLSEALDKLDLNTPKLIYTSQFPSVYPHVAQLLPPKKINQLFLRDLENGMMLFRKVWQGESLSPADRQTLDKLGNPFYAESIGYIRADQETLNEVLQQKGGFNIRAVPNVHKDKLFDHIASLYPGKVVLVDLWATWCSPCRSGIRAMEGMKDELTGKEIVFVYITNESSPVGTWRKLIPGIRGDHYRLNQEQWKTVCDRFNVSGIPSYVVISKDGSSKLRNDLRRHDIVKNELLKEIAL